jgi:hypothetical protein
VTTAIPDQPYGCEPQGSQSSGGEIGYCRPPKHTRWKKGECGNRNRMKKKATGKPALQLLDEFFAREVEIFENSIPRIVTNFEAIILQLWIKAMAGNKRAMNVFLKYQEFAAPRGSMGGLEVVEKIEHLFPEDEEDDVRERRRIQKTAAAFTIQGRQSSKS